MPRVLTTGGGAYIRSSRGQWLGAMDQANSPLVNRFKQLRIEYRIWRVARLRCFVERPNLMWYEEIYVTPQLRGRGFAKWLFAQSISEFRGRVEVDVLGRVPSLPMIFAGLGFRLIAPSERFYNCALWRLDRRRNGWRDVPGPGELGLVTGYCSSWETQRYRWRTVGYKLSGRGRHAYS